jgi:flagella basal body P-ring formation protein FlgA
MRRAVVLLLMICPASGGLLSPAPAFAAETVLVPGRVIYPGETVTAAALKEVTLAEGKVPPAHVVIDVEALDGKVARRTLLPGRYIMSGSLREAYLVEKGAAVEMTFVAGALTIVASAVTLEAGAAGDLVKVRNVDTGKIVSGVVLADGTIRVGG